MLQVSLDTSFLISFADPTRVYHSVAVEYFRYCLSKNIPMWISTVAAGEFQVGQPITDLPLQSFRIQPYNLPHAIKAASLFKILREQKITDDHDSRQVIINDIKLIAQAEDEGISLLITEDKKTLYKMAAQLKQLSQIKLDVLLLNEGFSAGRLANPAQGDLLSVRE